MIRILPGMALPGTLPAAQPPPPELPPTNDRRWWTWRIGLGVVAALVLVKLVGGGLAALYGGHYEFLAMDGDNPVSWDHCHAIRYTINPKGAPEGWEDIVDQAVSDVEDASGFVFADRGTTTKTQLIGTRYEGNEWEPVLILWSDQYQDGSLGGGVIGRGGPAAILVNGRQRYVLGKVSLDSTVKDPVATRMVLEHELGHVLGLNHTDDSSQLMYPTFHGQSGFGDGDRHGLQRLHDISCD